MNPERIEVRRADLYAQVWAEPMRRLAKQYGISDVGLAKVCRKLNIPVPPVGFWARKQHGYRVEQPPLQPTSQGISDVAFIERRPERPKLPEEVAALVAPKQGEQDRIRVPDRLRHPHPLVRQTAAAYREAKLNDYGTLTCVSQERRLALRVGRTTLGRALRIMDALIKALEARGFPVGISDRGGTYATVLDEKVGFGLEEKVTRHDHAPTKKEQEDRAQGRWVHPPRWDYSPTELLQLRTDAFTQGGERKTWADGKKHRLEELLNDVVAGLIVIAHALRRDRLAREREAEEFRQAQLRRAELERQRQEEQKRRQELEQHAALWIKSQRLRDYIEAVAHAAKARGASAESSAELQRWLSWARQHADRLDPLRNDLPVSSLGEASRSQ